MPATYEPIATTTLSSSASTITFSSIPSTYTDLRFTVVYTTSVANQNINVTLNSDTGTNYSYTTVYGSGSAAGSGRQTSVARFRADTNSSTTIPHFQDWNVFSYAGSTNKTVLMSASEDDNGSGFVIYSVGLWRGTAAVNTITLTISSGNFNSGTTATLYGIKAA